jgi:hypothetical protein
VPRATELPNFTPPDNVLVIYKSNATFNSDVINDVFLNRIIVPHVQRFNLQNSTVFLDSAPCHKTDTVKQKFTEAGIVRELIPPRFTNLLQPADVSWFASLKKRLHERWTNWYVNDEKSFTKQQNLRSPGYANIISWISYIWENFDSELIAKSFDTCGITSNHALSRILQTIIDNNQPISEYLVDETDCDDVDMNDNDLFDFEMVIEQVTSEHCTKCTRIKTKRCRAWINCKQCNRLYCSICKPRTGPCC